MFQFIRSLFQQEPLSPQITEDLNKAIKSEKVMVFSKSYCPYCTSTKNTLKKYQPPATVWELDTMKDGADYQRGLLELTGQKTVPNIFIDGKHIGGNSDLQALESSGKLAELLK